MDPRERGLDEARPHLLRREHGLRRREPHDRVDGVVQEATAESVALIEQQRRQVVPLERLAYGRSGDKGDASNVGIVARSPAAYSWVVENLTPALVKRLLGAIVKGGVDRYEIPSLLALNFVLHDSLGGGGTASLLTDAQGKTHAQALLRCEVEVPDEILAGL